MTSINYYITEAEKLKERFLKQIKEMDLNHFSNHIAAIDATIMDIRMLIYSYDKDMPLNECAKSLPSGFRCFSICTDSYESNIKAILDCIDRFMLHLNRAKM